jgi:hypothetical protein
LDCQPRVDRDSAQDRLERVGGQRRGVLGHPPCFGGTLAAYAGGRQREHLGVDVSEPEC